jgi:hypothetical protein
MRTAFDPFSFLVTSIAGWMNQHQHHVINYLIEENRVLREQIGNRRLRFSDDQRRRLAVKGKKLGRKILAQVATVVEECLCLQRGYIESGNRIFEHKGVRRTCRSFRWRSPSSFYGHLHRRRKVALPASMLMIWFSALKL